VSNTISSTKSGITAIRKMPGEIAASLGLVHKASIQAPLLQQAQDAAGRIAANIGQAKAGAQLATVGGNLYQIAADAYGDPAEWTTIAAANGLTDPVLIGVHMLTIPAQPDGLGGVPRA
jgi:nucleoid-associated protein YgaU